MKSNPNSKLSDAILWRSPDGAVIIRRRVRSAMRWPQHSAPIITIDVEPRQGSRIRPVGKRVDICLEHQAVEAFVRALVEADPTVAYQPPAHIPQKPLCRKAYFDRLNAQRWARKRGQS